MKKIVVSVVALILSVSVYYFLGMERVSEDAREKQDSSSVIPTQTAPTPSAEKSNAEPSSSSVSASSKTTLESAPNLEQIRTEVEKDPHSTPPSILAFAHSMGEKMKEARTSPEKARAFFGELSDCITTRKPGTSTVIQAVCLSNAQRLAHVNPEFKDDLKKLEELVPPEVRKLTR